MREENGRWIRWASTRGLGVGTSVGMGWAYSDGCITDAHCRHRDTRS